MATHSVMVAPQPAGERRSDGGAGNRPRNRSAPKLFPLQTLLDATGLKQHELLRQTHASGHAIAVAGLHGCTASQADRWAVRCGMHPASVWPDWYQLTEGDVA